MTERVHNFSAGPAALPEEVLKQAAEEILDYRNTGMSVMEMSHRSPVYEEIIGEAESLLRELMNIPASYRVLFLQGGASLQFAMLPMNLLQGKRPAFVHTGTWTGKAISEAALFSEPVVIASSENSSFDHIPDIDVEALPDDAAYLHIVTNNTIYGTRYTEIPRSEGIPLVGDMSSNILSEEYRIDDFGVVFAGAQKNIGPAGLTIVVIHEDLLKRIPETVPSMLNYAVHASKGSMFNTPPTYGIYLAMLVFRWLKKKGGVAAMEAINKKKAALLYDTIDSLGLYRGTVRREFRSRMNVCFRLTDDALEEKFLSEAEKEGLVNLRGHRSVGGVRASIYNAVSMESVEALVSFMKEFEKRA